MWGEDIVFTRGKTCLVEAASGAGKSSLCGYLYGYRRDYDGVIAFDGTDIRKLGVRSWGDVRRHSIAMMFQGLRLFPELTALENVQIKNNLTHHKTPSQIATLFESLGVADKAHARVDRLSFGQQQRVAFIRLLCQPADFLLLDEPVSHLDDTNAAVMGRILFDETRASGAGVIVTSIGKHLDLPYERRLAL